ncbi:MAG: nitrate reductase molybdenum cofactor assembly chaperone [Bacteroidetes bacterium]|nr:MAG: nitrate reductase molybdenum cofactor assembly chaperone [Bacteroidota bacterium]
MMEEPRYYTMFSKLFAYPEEGYREAMREAGNALTVPDCGLVQSKEQLDAFLQKTNELTLDDFEELYTRTFDINPVANLEIGWHLWGEAYERGAFLVNMRTLLKQHGITESSELPDHLTHVLAALGKMERNEAQEFTATFLKKALDKIVEGFKEKENPYEHLLLALQQIVMYHHQQGENAHG